MTFSEEPTFLRELSAHPEETTLRLVYADWLEDRGSVRAEFLRLQDAFRDCDPESEEHSLLRERESQLLLEVEEELREWYPGMDQVICLTHRRAIPVSVHLTAANCLAEFERISDQFPSIQSVKIRRWEHIDFEEFTRSPVLARIRELNLSQTTMTQAGLEELLSSPHLKNLETLNLTCAHLELDSVQLLNLLQLLPCLKGLILDWNRIQDRGAQSLVQSAYASRLETLSLCGCRLTNEDIAILSRSVQLSKLRHLSLGKNGLGSEAVEQLATAPVLSGLRSLNLSNNPVGHQGLLALLESQTLPELEELDLQYNLGNRFSKDLVHQLAQRYPNVKL